MSPTSGYVHVTVAGGSDKTSHRNVTVVPSITDCTRGVMEDNGSSVGSSDKVYSIIHKQENAHDDSIWSCAMGRSNKDNSPDGKFIACGAIDGIVNVFDIATGKLIHTLEVYGHAKPIRSLCFSPDSQLLVTGSDDNQIKIYDVLHANLAGTLSGHASWVLSVAFSPDNTHFVSRFVFEATFM
ncbi:WDR61-like protein [Mya arenaria]|uniref:WDR61-like protein n=1 Tax=Mya arenaria TaxID=6604 RepID=A0ABY7GFV3_MYAAR|nr:WDR61-like protein [Mya arenaria]